VDTDDFKNITYEEAITFISSQWNKLGAEIGKTLKSIIKKVEGGEQGGKGNYKC
jgi:hypothetical protein